MLNYSLLIIAALGFEVKKIATKSPTRQLVGNAQQKCGRV
jgi:hypothetical protein